MSTGDTAQYIRDLEEENARLRAAHEAACESVAKLALEVKRLEGLILDWASVDSHQSITETEDALYDEAKRILGEQ